MYLSLNISDLSLGSHGENHCDLATAAEVSFIMKLWEEAEVGRTQCYTAGEFHES